MVRGLKIVVTSIVIGSVFLAACGKSKGGGSSTASTPTSFSNTPAGYIGNGTWSGAITIPAGALPTYYQLAALTGICNGQACAQSFINIQVTLQNGAYSGNVPGYPFGYTYPGYPGAVNNGNQVGNTTGSFRLASNSGCFERSPVYTTGGSASFQMAAGLWNNTGVVQPPSSGEPSVRLNGQFTDSTQSVMNVQLYYNGSVVATGTIYNSNGSIYGGSYAFNGSTLGGSYINSAYCGGSVGSNGLYPPGTTTWYDSGYYLLPWSRGRR